MNKKNFLELSSQLESEIENGGRLKENDVFGPIMYKISFHSCLIIGVRSVAYANMLSEPYRSERNDYFDSIVSILEIIYSGFSKLTFEGKIKMCGNTNFTPRTSKERFEAMQKIKEFLPKLKTSWVEKC